MKKLMFMLAAVAIAASTQAASVWWTCTNVKDSGGNAVSGLAYFLTTDMLSYSDAQALAGKGAAAFTTALGSAYSYTGSSGAFGKTSANAVSNEALGLTGGNDYTGYLMIFDTATITDESNYYLTATKNFSALGGATDVASVKWGTQATASVAEGAWSAVKGSAVPEPTSGLLMLVGLAGLALRRGRRA